MFQPQLYWSTRSKTKCSSLWWSKTKCMLAFSVYLSTLSVTVAWKCSSIQLIQQVVRERYILTSISHPYAPLSATVDRSCCSMTTAPFHGQKNKLFPASRFRLRQEPRRYQRKSRSGTTITKLFPATTITAVKSTMTSFGSIPAILTTTCTLLISASVGYWSEQSRYKLFPSCSVLVTLCTAALLSTTFPSLPKQHVLYDYCWSTILPASLALLLLSLPPLDSDDAFNVSKPNYMFGTVKRLAVPFLLASTGSILGCLVSWIICCRYPKLWLSPNDASLAAACLAASFIGGSVNFFATAAAIVRRQNHHYDPSTTSYSRIARTSNSNSDTLLSAMAAVDIVVMALYFALLSSALQSKRMQRWFRSEPHDLHSNVTDEIVTNTSTNDTRLHTTKAYHILPAVFLSGLLALLFVEVSKQLESIMNRFVAGTACAFLSIMVPYFTTKMNRIQQFRYRPFWCTMQQYSEPMSRFAFLLLFATMGITADLSTALHNGPACLCFSLTALFVHSIVTLFGSRLWQRLTYQSRNELNNRSEDSHKRIDLADVLIASNAAIGGPATAAAFCGQISKQTSILQRRNLTVAATFWGVVGYAIGTTIGVTIYRVLQSAL
jgi:uncharacterized membrane protein